MYVEDCVDWINLDVVIENKIRKFISTYNVETFSQVNVALFNTFKAILLKPSDGFLNPKMKIILIYLIKYTQSHQQQPTCYTSKFSFRILL